MTCVNAQTKRAKTVNRRSGRDTMRVLAGSGDLDAAQFEAKRVPPPRPPGVVTRPRLLRQLEAATHLPLAVVNAPAGYGKTALLLDWARNDERPFAWVTLDPGDNDAAVLLLSIAYALDEIEPVAIDVYDSLAGPHPRMSSVVLPRFGRWLRQRERRFVLVLDDAHVLNAPESLEVLSAIAEQLPAGSQLVLSSRGEPALPIGGLRAARGMIELRARDLAMTRGEAAELLAATGLELGAAGLETLAQQAEGWPVGLHLAVVSLVEQTDREAALACFAGDDRIVSDYLREELLAHLSPAVLSFLTRTSVLDHLSGPLCDAVLERRGSAAVLRGLARGNVLLAALDHHEEWYRYHGLLAQMLRAELHKLQPGLERQLHLRASEWHAEAGDSKRSIEHAVAAGDVHRAGDLLWDNVQEYVTRGHNSTMQDWLHSFSSDQVGAYLPLALTAANSSFAMGDLDRVQHWTDAGAQAMAEAPPADRTPQQEAGIAIMRAAICARGMGRMADDAMHAYELEARDSPWRAICCLFIGVSRHLTGDREGAVRRLEEGVRRGAVPAPNVQSLCLAQLALTAIDDDDWDAAALFAARAIAQVDRCGLADYPTSALVFAVSADVRAHRGLVEEAKADSHRAAGLLADLRDFVPWYQAETRAALARAATRLGDVARARKLLRDAGSIAARTPDAVILQAWIDDVSTRVDALSGSGATGLASLTTAELRILQFLPTHLSFREIGAQLFVSANTVKTQAHSVYRKLNVVSRSEAVGRAFDLGMLGAHHLGAHRGTADAPSPERARRVSMPG